MVALGLYTKALREKRNEKFEDNWLEKISALFSVEKRDNGSFSITTEKYGVVDFYPKANNLLIRKQNRWVKPGLKWIVKKLLIEKHENFNSIFPISFSDFSNTYYGSYWRVLFFQYQFG